MADDRTQEQVEADNALHAAIERCAHAYWPDKFTVVTDFVVLAVREDPATEGEREYNYLLPGGTMPWHRILGIVHLFRTLMERSASRGYGLDTD